MGSIFKEEIAPMDEHSLMWKIQGIDTLKCK